jgi:hypothetical protein
MERYVRDSEKSMTSITDTVSRRYSAIVFKQAPPTADFSRSTEVVLPGEHTQDWAWQLVFAELRGPRAGELIGGDVRPC